MLHGISDRKAAPPVGDGYAQGLGRDVREPTAPRPAGAPRQRPKMPWQGHADEEACNFAVRHLTSRLPARLEFEGRVHAETCLAAIGAIAGFTAQHALISQLKRANDLTTLRQLQTVRTISRGHYFFGEPLNRTLLPVSRADADAKLWSLAAGAAIASGLHSSRLPDPQQTFNHVVNKLGGKYEGMPSVPERHFPKLPVKPLLGEVWPVAMMCLIGRFPDAPREYGVAAIQFWPAIAAHVAGTLIRQTRSAVDPRTSLIIVMESAIYASKLTPGPLKTG